MQQQITHPRTGRKMVRCSSGHMVYVDPISIISCVYCCKGVNCTDLQTFLDIKKGILLNQSKHTFYALQEKLELRCEKGHSWITTWKNIYFQQTWCGVCSKYKSETKVRDIFENILGVQFPCVRPVWLHCLELDGYNEEKQIAFEYSGIQHFEFDPFFHKTIQEFQLLQQRDKQKAKICHERGIRLFIIPYTVHKQDLQYYVRNLLKS